ncbi:hypothetical protein COHA_005933 [Chlorella ohadii]|uniref:GrpE protein homolog n=1 Tax=Chlorella ohadii TaxID=2649997 RepID=A0AAD5DQI4_9CHLO|nr:hypothetical protein COHA_005933 [Chlorella ohadii]
MQRAVQSVKHAPAARCTVRRPLTASSSRAVAVRRVQRLQAAQESVETAEAGTSDTELQSMAASLVERAKLVVETQHVDDAFTDTFVPELEAELAALRTRAEQAEASASQMEETLKDVKDKYVRLQADFENYRKRNESEKVALRSTVRGDTVAELLPLVDNFELAKQQLKLETEGEKRVDAAYQGLYKQMVELFRGLGLEATPGVGSPFDPNLHDGVMRELNNDVPDGTVLEEFRKGFMFGEKLLRPAMVKVSYSDAPAAAADSSADDAAASGSSD